MARQVEFSLYERLRIANAIFGGASYTPATSYTLKAYSDTVGLDGTGGTELTNAGYSAIAITNNTTNFPTATSSLPKSNAVEFSKNFTADGSIKSEGLFDQDGHLIIRIVYDTPLVVASGQQWRFAVGSITLNPSNP